LTKSHKSRWKSLRQVPGRSGFLRMLAENNPAMQVGMPLVEMLRINYWLKLRGIAQKQPLLRNRMAGMIIAPDKMSFYLGRTHAAIEYFGPISAPRVLHQNDATMVTFTDCRENDDFVQSIVGMKFSGTGGILDLAPEVPVTNLFVPTSADAARMMFDHDWDVTAEDMKFAMNVAAIGLPSDSFSRLVNCFFYSVDQDRLRTRRIQWIDFFPIQVISRKETKTTIEEKIFTRLWPDLESVIEHDSKFSFPYPATFEHERLALLNRFRELLLAPDSTEPKITGWLAKPAHQFVLKMALPAVGLLHQKTCVWQTDSSCASLVPDFFAVKADGYADIVEFKLPTLKGASIVGSDNRESLSAEIHSYIAQTRTYKEYFQESANREFVQQKYGIKVKYPKRFLVLGRRWEVASNVWRNVLAEFPDLSILTYDDLIDSVVALLYQNPKA
jgi:hypothetical protein